MKSILLELLLVGIVIIFYYETFWFGNEGLYI
jgi:hypothetical protein